MKEYHPEYMQFMLLQHHKPKTIGDAKELIAKAIRKHGNIFDCKG